MKDKDTKPKQEAPKEDIDRLMLDAILEKPIAFTLDGRFFYLYQPSIGTSILSDSLLKQLDIDSKLLSFNEQFELLRISTNKRDIMLRLIAIHTFQRRSDAIVEEKVQRRMEELHSLDAAELSTLFVAILNWSALRNKFTKHIGLDAEKKTREKIRKVKEEDTSSIVFGGLSLYGTLLDQAAERYGWELGYILWGLSAINLNMMLSDSVQSVYLTEKEQKKAHVQAGGKIIKADDPKNAALVERFLSMS